MAIRPVMQLAALSVMFLLAGLPTDLVPGAGAAAGPSTPPVAQGTAYGVWASTSTGVIMGAEPIAATDSISGRTDQEAYAGRVLLRSADGATELARVEGLRVVAVSNAQSWGAGHASMQARSFSKIVYASLLQGLVEAQVLHANVFASNGARLDPGASRVGMVRVQGTAVNVQGTNVVIPIVGVGTLTVNETTKDPATGFVQVRSLHLRLLGGTDIVVGNAEARAMPGSAVSGSCRTWAEAYPAGSTSLALSTTLGTRHWAVVGDPGGTGTGWAHVHAANVTDVSPALVQAQALGAYDFMRTDQNTSASATAFVTGLDLLGGLVHADAVRAVATTRASPWGNGSASYSTAGTLLAGVTVGNATITETPPPNFLNLSLVAAGKNVGFVRLNEQTWSAAGSGGSAQAVLRINLLHVVLTTRYLGLPAGTELVVGHAIAISACGPAATIRLDFGDPLGLRGG